MVENYIVLVRNTCRTKCQTYVEIKDFEIPNLIITYITVHHSAIFLVGFQKMCFYISREAMEAVRDYVI